MNKKIAGFWIRFLAGFIDIAIIFLITIIWTFCIFIGVKTLNQEPWRYYFWFLIIILSIFFTQVIIPSFIFKGKTIGRLILRIETIIFQFETYSKKILFIYISKKEIFYSFSTIFFLIVFMILVSPSTTDILINNISLNNNLNSKLTTGQQITINISFSLYNFLILISFILTITIAGKNKIGVNDKYSGTRTVYSKKYINIPEDKIIEPEKVEWNSINWQL